MTNVLFIAGEHGSRQWEHELWRRLSAAGHAVAVRHSTPEPFAARPLDRILSLESRRFGASLATATTPVAVQADDSFIPDIAIDLTGTALTGDLPVLRLAFNGHKTFEAGAAAMLAGRAQPELQILHDGVVVGRARPMIGDRVWLSRYFDDVLAGAIALVESALAQFQLGALAPIADASSDATPDGGDFLRHYLPFVARGFGARLVRKVWGWRKQIYWQVAYRLIDGPGIAETGALDGPGFTVLPDDGARFYADPFPFEHDGRKFLFVEEFPYATRKGVVSVAELDGNGVFGTPRIVLEEPHHLSYPQILRSGDEVFMLPESSAAHELVLYRASRFPDEWVRDTVLIADRKINDATVLEKDGQFWLVATEFIGHGSASDKMVVYSAPDLRGPWTPHKLNPIAIDHSATRPGGAFVCHVDIKLLPVQNGSATYGGGLGLMSVERIDASGIDFSAPRPVRQGPAWDRAGIHTLNRVGSLEVIDSAG